LLATIISGNRVPQTRHQRRGARPPRLCRPQAAPFVKEAARVHRILSRVRHVRATPLSSGQDEHCLLVIWGQRQQKSFFKRDLTDRQITSVFPNMICSPGQKCRNRHPEKRAFASLTDFRLPQHGHRITAPHLHQTGRPPPHRISKSCRTSDLRRVIELERPIESRLIREGVHRHGRRCRPKISFSQTSPLPRSRTRHELASWAGADSAARRHDAAIGTARLAARIIRTPGLMIGQPARFVRDRNVQRVARPPA